MVPDPRPPSRIENPELLKALHVHWKECVVCLATELSAGKLSLHHVHKHPRDDVQENLVMLCGSGTTGCHGLVEHHDPQVMSELGFYIARNRPDIIRYLVEKFGDQTQALIWMNRQFGG